MMMRPSEYPRRILLAVSGLTPQIVTETLFALATRQDDPYVPTEVHLLTTTEGAARAKLLLLSEEPGWFGKLCADYGLAGIRFPEENIHVLCDHKGDRLDDIRTEDDNQCAADGITECVRLLTSDDSSALHVSLAGGRKTMGFYVAYALSLFGREQDRLSHVLAPPEFESASGFFYPTPKQHVIKGKDNKPLDTADAKLMLASIPFVSMRLGLPVSLLKGTSSYSKVVGAANASIAPAELTIDLKGYRVRAAGRVFDMPRPQIALLSVFARRAKKCEEALEAPVKDGKDIDWANRYFVELCRCVAHPEDLPDATLKILTCGMDGDYFSMLLSRLQAQLRKELGNLATPYLIDDGGTRQRRYRMTLAAEAIHYEALPEPEVKEDAGRPLYVPGIAVAPC